MSNATIYREIPACDAAALAGLADFGVADLHESQAPELRVASLLTDALRPIAPGWRIIGQAVTMVNAPGDNLMLYAALDVVQPGQVLVMSNGGVARGALFGDVSASFALKRRVAGVVVDGPVRDIASLREMSCPVWSTCVSPSHPEKHGPGAVNVPISCGGRIVYPGDIIVADDDAVLVLRPGELPSVFEKAAARRDREIDYRRRIAAGEDICDILGMRSVLQESGARYLDGSWPGPARQR